MNLKAMPCPECNRKGLHYADHAHAFGWKDYNKVECRFCGKTFEAVSLADRPQIVKGKE